MGSEMCIRDRVKVKYEIPNDKPEMFGEYNKELDDMCAQLLAKQTPAAG